MAALEPPFKAADLQGLYKKVLAGKFKPIPENYSQELNSAICSLLRQKSKQRPDTFELLKNPILQSQGGSTTEDTED